MRTTWPLLLVLLAKTAAADVLPPPEPMRCGRGQEVTTDHGGTRCVFRACTTDSDCPSGMYCVGMDETYCDPRGEPCSTSRVWRCNEDRRAGDPPPRPRPPGPEPERRFAQPPPGDPGSGAVIATGDTDQPNPDPNGRVLETHRRSGCACSTVGAGAPVGGALLALLGAAAVWAQRRRRTGRVSRRP
ncbi:MAG: hypothetical protein JW940_37235 [Polyangiaceae bacterium]|nr:hypothetical protein [Polyangiaceae bacterium]